MTGPREWAPGRLTPALRGGQDVESPFIIPLAVFAMVVLIVAIAQMVRIRDKELEVQQKLHLEGMEHQRRMKELEIELARIKERG